MILLQRHNAWPLKPKKINSRLMELEAAKEILAEIFHARPADIDDMIQSRLEEREMAGELMLSPGELWPEAFCLGEEANGQEL